ncbi:hypothetical protein GCM10012280_68540 [Wenjunlia tyrosinilytica]|uniref:Uncharacterized protein n=1 Tax=Wenjunlia tyrosinilytica TaxID=1544741 RepID=A0A918E124_9ACTN|nr:hypothetical protein GCM10012280_68540 [Wenjunlia tyrosinilytica]
MHGLRRIPEGGCPSQARQDLSKTRLSVITAEVSAAHFNNRWRTEEDRNPPTSTPAPGSPLSSEDTFEASSHKHALARWRTAPCDFGRAYRGTLLSRRHRRVLASGHPSSSAARPASKSSHVHTDPTARHGVR